MKKIHSFDLYFDASNKYKDKRITVGQIKDWAKEEDENLEQKRGTISHYLRSVKKERWFDKLLDKIYV